ncbi:MAG: protein-disulfide reductase DsbD [Campylobacterales bacterium]|nr:protein-disulfide reductase DsbD [Campylobacterales bacterium]
MRPSVLLIISFIFMFFSPLSAQNKFLSLEEAFVLTAEVVDSRAIVHFELADDIYVYADKVSVEIAPNENVSMGAFVLPNGNEHDGDMAYFSGQTLSVPLQKNLQGSGLAAFELSVNYQGCSEKGLCYEPSVQSFVLEADLDVLTTAGMAPVVDLDLITDKELSEEANDDPITALLSGGNLFYILGGFFIFGLLLSLTPCVFPMVPILSSVIISHGSEMTTKKAFLLSMVYVQAMAITYTIAGVVAGLSGAGVQAAFQTPWVIVAFSAVFILLALSMFGLFEIQMPQALQSYLNRKTEGRGKGYTSIAIMGLLSALIVGPCVAAPLAAALGFISQSGDAFLGGMALYALSMGMGIPLLIVGTGAGKFMPRPGSWMDAVKSIFGVMMLAVAIWMLSRVLDNSIIIFMWSALAMFVAVNIGAFEAKNEAYCNPCYAAQKSIGMMVFLVAVALFIGSITNASSVLNPLEKILPSHTVISSSAQGQSEENSFVTIGSLAELDAIIAESKGKKIMLDFYADWCTSCKELEHLTFSNTAVKRALRDYVLVQADVTANTGEQKALSKRFGLFGPPAMIFFDENGREFTKERTIGFLPPKELLQKLEKLEK